MSKTRNLSDLLDANGDVKSTALDNVPASDLINDTTPQLGGNLDCNTFDISFGDNEKARFGNADDLQIFHDGSNSYIIDNGTGNLIVRGVNLSLQSTSGEDYINCTNNGGVTLRYDNGGKLNTTSTGVNVTGTLTATAFSGDGSALTNVPAGISNVNTVKVTSTGTYTPTSGTKFFTVYACGGGGGSGGVNATNNEYQTTSGGNAGCTCVKTYTATEMGASASVTIGSGGSAGSSSSNGGTGGDTTFNPAGTGATITGEGGNGSYSFSTAGSGTGLPNGNHRNTGLQNGDYVIPGELGSYGHHDTRPNYRVSTTANYRFGGRGGNSAVGFGASFTNRSSSGRANGNSAPANSGGGASGCVSFAQSATTTGGSGGSGIVIIMEYA